MQTRRELLKSLAAAATTTLALPEPRARASSAEGRIVHPAPKADSIIVLWMAGGMAAPDTFDPKKYKPFKRGLAVADVISTFPSIPTAIDGVKIVDGLPEIAKVLDRATLIRSHVQADLGAIPDGSAQDVAGGVVGELEVLLKAFALCSLAGAGRAEEYQVQICHRVLSVRGPVGTGSDREGSVAQPAGTEGSC